MGHSPDNLNYFERTSFTYQRLILKFNQKIPKQTTLKLDLSTLQWWIIGKCSLAAVRSVRESESSLQLSPSPNSGFVQEEVYK